MHKVCSNVAGCKKGDSTGVTRKSISEKYSTPEVISERDRERVFILICTHNVKESSFTTSEINIGP